MPLDARAAVAHLLRRTGFGPTAAEVDAAAAVGYEATVDRLLDFSAPDPADAVALPTFAPYQALGARNLTAAQRQAVEAQRIQDDISLIHWWLNRMVTTAHPLREKLTWFWHGHFATSVQKVQLADFMARQNQIFRSAGSGNFEALTQLVAKDPAMLVWLDASTNIAAHPNENFARELMELFTLGIGNYTEDDVKDAARAFTGWRLNPQTFSWVLAPRQHDSGVKTVLGQTGSWSGEDVIHILTNSAPSAPFIVSRLWSHFAYPVSPTDPVIRDLVPPFAETHDVHALVRAMLLHPQFVSDAAVSELVKQPIEWVLGVCRVLGLPGTDTRLPAVLRDLGQVPFDPPNVGGWPQNEYWLTTASSLGRLQIAAALASTLAPSSLVRASPSDRPAVAAHLLSVTWTAPTAAALAKAAASPQALLALALVAPEYVLA